MMRPKNRPAADTIPADLAAEKGALLAEATQTAAEVADWNQRVDNFCHRWMEAGLPIGFALAHRTIQDGWVCDSAPLYRVAEDEVPSQSDIDIADWIDPDAPSSIQDPATTLKIMTGMTAAQLYQSAVTDCPTLYCNPASGEIGSAQHWADQWEEDWGDIDTTLGDSLPVFDISDDPRHTLRYVEPKSFDDHLWHRLYDLAQAAVAEEDQSV